MADPSGSQLESCGKLCPLFAILSEVASPVMLAHATAVVRC